MKQISTFFHWLKWVLKGKPMIQYLGYHCGICGKWVNKPFSIPEYKSDGEWWDTWGTCEQCAKDDGDFLFFGGKKKYGRSFKRSSF